jgi:hypothetical protein
MTMFDVRTSLSRQVVDEVKKHMPDKIFARDPADGAPERGAELRQDDLRLRPVEPRIDRLPQPRRRGDRALRAVTKYGHAFLVGLQSNLVYRWNFAVRSLFWFFHLAVVFILWGAVFAAKAAIGGFTSGRRSPTSSSSSSCSSSSAPSTRTTRSARTSATGSSTSSS